MSEFEHPPFPLADALTAKTKALCIGIEQGRGEIFELVTPTTAELLRWWFSEDMKVSRSWMNFHPGQQQAILNTIVAHEVLGTPQLGAQSLLQLYQTEAAGALLEGSLATQLSIKVNGKAASMHPKYCLKMATGTGKTWVLQALLVWQLLNKNAALAAGIDDARFTRQFLIIVPGLIVYERLLDALCGKMVENADGSQVRDFAQSDVAQYADLFIPAAHRDAVLGFVRGNVCKREEIGLKTTGNGVIAVCNWHVLVEADEVNDDVDEESIHAEGADLVPSEVARRVLPLAPGRATGNALDMLDRRYARGNVLAHLAALPELMVFNDEAHHIHAVKGGERDAVRWQEALTTMAESKKSRFVQVDFSATPYVDAGTAKKPRKEYFPHIITDFDLKTAMRLGLVKSLVLDKRKELAALPLDFNALRDNGIVSGLSEGQQIMLRAGLHKLQKLEADFAGLDAQRRPKMLVVCEDTAVSPFVAKFVENELNDPQAAMTIDSGKKSELSDKEWAVVRGQLFNVDRHASPRVIVSVLMLREGFDVNNICVIVPLRASGAQILLEQTIGRGLRLMWRDSDYDDIKRENRSLLKANKAPNSLIDVLSIVEHPKFDEFYADLMAEGLAGETDEGDDTTSGTGDMITAHLREDYAPMDFGIPFIVQEEEQFTEHREIDISSLPAFTALSLVQLQALLGKGDSFVSQDLQSSTLFGDYRVNGAVMNVNSYNDFLSRMTRRISQALSQPMKGNRVAQHAKIPYMQVNTAQLAGWLDDYIWTGLFGESFNPVDTTAAHENWRILLLQAVQEHMTKVFAEALLAAEQQWTHGATQVMYRQLSEVKSLPMRASNALELSKSMYTHTAYPTHSGGLEHTLMLWAQQDSEVAALCKIHEVRHDAARLRYVKEDGLPAFYVPDFLIRVDNSNIADGVNSGSTVYLVETKAQGQLSSPNVQRKLKAAVAWCERINGVAAEQRRFETWHYVLLGESTVAQWQKDNKRCSELLSFAKLRNTTVNTQVRLI